MSTKEIQLLRKKFIIIAMFSFFLVMLFIGAVINTISFTVTTVSIRSTLTSISRNDGRSEEDSDKVDEKRPSLPTVVDAFSPISAVKASFSRVIIIFLSFPIMRMALWQNITATQIIPRRIISSNTMPRVFCSFPKTLEDTAPIII